MKIIIIITIRGQLRSKFVVKKEKKKKLTSKFNYIIGVCVNLWCQKLHPNELAL